MTIILLWQVVDAAYDDLLAGVQVALRYVLYDLDVNSPGELHEHALSAAVRYLEHSGVTDIWPARDKDGEPIGILALGA